MSFYYVPVIIRTINGVRIKYNMIVSAKTLSYLFLLKLLTGDALKLYKVHKFLL
jgi:hypothetical protein